MDPILVARSGNRAVDVNPPIGLDLHITSHGSDWYWAAFSLLALAALVFTALGYRLRPTNERLFFYNTIWSTFTLSITYFTLASNLGWTDILVEFHHAGDGTRQIFYARYVGWFLAFPAVILSFSVISLMPWPTTLFTILAQEVMVVSLLIGSLIRSSYKWGYFVFALAAFFIVVYNLLFSYRRDASAVSNTRLGRASLSFASYSFILMLYFISWALSEGGNVIQPDSEAVFYGVLDLVVFIVINGFFLWTIRDLDFAELGIVYPHNALFHEKKSFDTTRGPIENGNHQGHQDHDANPAPVEPAPNHDAPVTDASDQV